MPLLDKMVSDQNGLIAALLKEQRRRDCARRHCRPYKGHILQRQRFPGSPRMCKSGREVPIRY
jgi:hypothetical protein